MIAESQGASSSEQEEEGEDSINGGMGNGNGTVEPTPAGYFSGKKNNSKDDLSRNG